MKKKVAVAMSGGVDSGVAAAILVREGYKCAGFHMRLWQESLPPEVSSYVHSGGVNINFENKCCSTESLEAARRTAHKLGIPFYVVDFVDVFKKKVVDYFLEEYAAGLTPNPCVMCNKFVKFGELLEYVRKLGYDFLATGHYARVVSPPRCAAGATPPRRCLLMGKDKTKDQSYFLYNLSQKQIAQVMFPVGDYTKKQVVAIAKKWSLPVAERPESQEICFFPETDYRPFLRRQIPEKITPGEVVDSKARVIGRHYGLPLYTIGQRHGFEIISKTPPMAAWQKAGLLGGGEKRQKSSAIPPFYVISKDSKKNQLIVGFGKEAEKKEFWVKEVNWINQLTAKRLPLDAKVRIRHQGELLAARVQRLAFRLKVILDEPERGIAPGQAAVFYKKEEVLGGGIITT